MKMNQTVSLDMDIVLEGRLQKICFSDLFNNYLREYLVVKRDNPIDNEEDLKNQIARQKAMLVELEALLQKEAKEKEANKPKVILDG